MNETKGNGNLESRNSLGVRFNRNGMVKSSAPKKPPGSYVPKNAANPSGHSNIAREIEQKAALYGKTDDDEPSAPFNFQVANFNSCEYMKNNDVEPAVCRSELYMPQETSYTNDKQTQ